MSRVYPAIAFVLGAAAIVGCERETRDFGPRADAGRPSVQTGAPSPALEHYERNAQALASGKRLFGWYNCSGCHAAGGGGSGPALMDDVWIYGSDPLTIYQTIHGGRPNGMPAFGKRIPEDQIWQLVAYVRSLAGLGSTDAAPNRDDAMLGHPPEAQLDQQQPKTATPSGASTRP